MSKDPAIDLFREINGVQSWISPHLSWHQNTVKQAFWVP